MNTGLYLQQIHRIVLQQVATVLCYSMQPPYRVTAGSHRIELQHAVTIVLQHAATASCYSRQPPHRVTSSHFNGASISPGKRFFLEMRV